MTPPRSLLESARKVDCAITVRCHWGFWTLALAPLRIQIKISEGPVAVARGQMESAYGRSCPHSYIRPGRRLEDGARRRQIERGSEHGGKKGEATLHIGIH